MKMTVKKKRYTWVSVLSVVVLIAVWELCTDVFQFVGSNIMPSPVKVVESFIYKLSSTAPDGSTLLQHIGASLQVALTGYAAGAVIGIPMGVIMAWYKKADLFIRPLFDLLRPMPPIAWIPIMIIFLGIGIASKAAIIFVSAFVPCVLNAYTGIKQTSPVHIWVARTFGASRLRILFKVAIPSALPNIFTGLSVSLSCAWSALVAAELLASSRGLGYMIQINRMIGRPDLIIVGMLTIGLFGAALSAVLSRLQKLLVKGGRY